jgi:putative tryptophan/tyrosine transport system substrate-binding protein
MLGRWLEMLKEMVPSIERASLIFNPDTAPYYSVYLRDFKALPKTLAVELLAMPVHNEAEIEGAIVALARNPGAGLISAGDPFTRRASCVDHPPRGAAPNARDLRVSTVRG